jgi:hypothetical protein
MSRAWSSFSVFAVMSTTIRSVCDSTTSNAVITPPTLPMALARSPAALADGGASSRRVIEYPGPGTGMALTLSPVPAGPVESYLLISVTGCS